MAEGELEQLQLPVPPAERAEREEVPIPQGFDAAQWDKAVAAATDCLARLNQALGKCNRDVLPLYFKLGGTAEKLVGQKDPGTQRSALDVFARASGANRTLVQKCAAFNRVFGAPEMIQLVAKRLGKEPEKTTGADVCKLLADEGINISTVNELTSLGNAKVVLGLVERVTKEGLSVRELRTAVQELVAGQPELLTDAGARRRLQRQQEIQEQGGDRPSPKAKGPLAAYKAVAARAEAYLEVAGGVEEYGEGLDSLEPTDARKALAAAEEALELLADLEATARENGKTLKKSIVALKKASK
jgi:hypothetical protein